jgi:hypothetical protein
MKLLFVLFFVLASNAAYSLGWAEKVIEKVNAASSLGCGKYPDIDDLQTKFDCESAFLNVSNSLYIGWLTSDKVERKDDLFCFWDRGNSNRENFNEIFANPIVRLNVASLLGQLNKIKQLDLNLEEQREYARSFISSDNKVFLLDSIHSLGWTGEHSDAQYLLKLIKKEEQGVAENAVLALINLLNNDYHKTLTELNVSLKRESLKNFIEEKLSQ